MMRPLFFVTMRAAGFVGVTPADPARTTGSTCAFARTGTPRSVYSRCGISTVVPLGLMRVGSESPGTVGGVSTVGAIVVA